MVGNITNDLNHENNTLIAMQMFGDTHDSITYIIYVYFELVLNLSIMAKVSDLEAYIALYRFLEVRCRYLTITNWRLL